MTDSLFDLLPETIAAREAEQAAADLLIEAEAVFRQWVQYGVLLAGPDGATHDAWVCPYCGIGEASAYILSLTHGVDVRNLHKLPDGSWRHGIHGWDDGEHPNYGRWCPSLHAHHNFRNGHPRDLSTIQKIFCGNPVGSIKLWFPTREAALAALAAART
ncbi:hypothetical protein [Nakamurella lactea]|uniref:hypothetical protein n=1 Tax=Nakamurella lactea TaxID=459515 RepID=UPI000407BCB3|nr:hypothetical protein [Nakamurella lactea]